MVILSGTPGPIALYPGHKLAYFIKSVQNLTRTVYAIMKVRYAAGLYETFIYSDLVEPTDLAVETKTGYV